MEVPCKDAVGGKKPIVHVGDDGKLQYIDHLQEPNFISELLQKQYLPTSTALIESPLKHVDVFIQGDELDLTNPEWDAFGDYDSLDAVRDVVCKYAGEQLTYGQDGVVAKIECKRTDDAASRGVSVAFSGSTRLLNTDLLAFEKDELASAKLSRSGSVADLYSELDQQKARSKNNPNKMRQIAYCRLVELMDRPPEFTADEWKHYIDQARKKGSDGLESIRRSVGMFTRANVLLTTPMQLDYSKRQLIAMQLEAPQQLDASSSSPPPPTLCGAIFRTIVEGCFRVEVESLRSPPAAPPLLALQMLGEQNAPQSGGRKRRAAAPAAAADEDDEGEEDERSEPGTRPRGGSSSRTRQPPERLSDTQQQGASSSKNDKKKKAAAEKRLKTKHKPDMDAAIAERDWTKLQHAWSGASADIALL